MERNFQNENIEIPIKIFNFTTEEKFGEKLKEIRKIKKKFLINFVF